MSPNPIILHFPHSNIGISHIPKWNTFFPTKPHTHFLSSFTQSGPPETLRVTAPKTRFAKRIGFTAFNAPDGSWWALPELREDEADPTAAMMALRRMWELVADERWVAFVAVGSLVVAAVSNIHFLHCYILKLYDKKLKTKDFCSCFFFWSVLRVTLNISGVYWVQFSSEWCYLCCFGSI